MKMLRTLLILMLSMTLLAIPLTKEELSLELGSQKHYEKEEVVDILYDFGIIAENILIEQIDEAVSKTVERLSSDFNSALKKEQNKNRICKSIITYGIPFSIVSGIIIGYTMQGGLNGNN